MGFTPPLWAATPAPGKQCHLQIAEHDEPVLIPVSNKPYYLIGRDREACDIHLDHESCSRIHAALVHHSDGRCFLIDLASRKGTTVGGKAIPKHKPTHLPHRAAIVLGGSPQRLTYLEKTAPPSKRPADQRGDAQPPKKANMQVRASHLLVKHRDSRRPSSWKEAQVTRSREEALAMIQAFREQLVSGQAEFGELAGRESHCSSAQRGGDLGFFGPGQMQAAFEQATFALQVGELSEPVSTDSGVHLILRTG